MSAGRRRTAAAWAAAGLAVVTLGACGEDRGASVSTQTEPPPPRRARPGPDLPPPAAKVGVAESDYRLDPARIRVDRPATLEIEIRTRSERGDSVGYNVIADLPGSSAITL